MAGENNYEWTKGQTRILIDAVKRFPCLWKIKSLDYKNRTMKKTAVRTVQLEMGIESLTSQDILKKIQTLRGQYRKERKLVNQSALPGTDPDYTPKLWCYESLHFMNDDNVFKESTSCLDPLDEVLFVKNDERREAKTDDQRRGRETEGKEVGHEERTDFRSKESEMGGMEETQEARTDGGYQEARTEGGWQEARMEGGWQEARTEDRTKLYEMGGMNKRQETTTEGKDGKQKNDDVSKGRAGDTTDETLALVVNEIKSLQQEDKSDEIDEFFQFMSSSLRACSDDQRDYCQALCFDALRQARRGRLTDEHHIVRVAAVEQFRLQ